MNCMRKLLLIVSILAFLCSCEDISTDQPDDIDVIEKARRMQAFVQNISAYARKTKPGFIVIPQNGAELAFYEANPNNVILTSYISAIDGIGNEELFYNGSLDVDDRRLGMLRTLKNHVKKIMVADYVSEDNNISNSIQRSRTEGFIAFPRSSDNYDYGYIPTTTELGISVNTKDINSLADAENYLYFINPDNYTKQQMLDRIATTNYDVILIDLFPKTDNFTSSDMARLKTKNNGKKRLVIAYMNIGAAENFRYYWQGWRIGSPSWIKKGYPGYPNEYYVEYWHPQWQNIIFGNNSSYLKKIIDAGFDGVYLDNVEAYYYLSN